MSARTGGFGHKATKRVDAATAGCAHDCPHEYDIAGDVDGHRRWAFVVRRSIFRQFRGEKVRARREARAALSEDPTDPIDTAAST